MTIHEKYRTETFIKSFSAWAHGVLRMKIGNYLQHKKSVSTREVELQDQMGGAADSAASEVRRFLIECLKQLMKEKPRYGRILNLTHQGFSTSQICEKIEMTANHYYVSLNRSRSLMKACMESKGVAL